MILTRTPSVTATVEPVRVVADDTNGLEGRIERTAPFILSADETLDIGEDTRAAGYWCLARGRGYEGRVHRRETVPL